VRSGSLLRANLHDVPVPASDIDHPSTLAHEQGERLLDVHVLSGGARQHRLQRVPVVRGGNNDRLNRLVVEQPAEIADANCWWPRLHDGLREPAAVDLGNGHAVYVRLAPKVDDVPFPDEPETNETDADAVVRTMDSTITRRGERRRRGGLKEEPACR
jgi:hypothetical protein